MEKILSQDEVDALLRGLSDGEIEPEKADQGEAEGIRVHDLTSQDRIVRGRMPTLEIINDRFARLQRISLSAALRRVVDITVTQSAMIKFGEFIRTLPVPTSLNILKMEPLRGHALLVVESRLVFNLLDCFFGGTGKSSYKIEGRDFTSIEQRVIAKLVQTTLKDLEASWKPVTPIGFQFVRSETNPQFATIVSPTDLVITVHYEMEMDHLMGKIILCLPYSTIEPIRSKLHAGFQSDRVEVDVEWLERLRRRLHDIDVELLVELGRTSLTGRELLNLEVGDVIMLDQEVNSPLPIKVQGISRLKGMPGVSRGQQASMICGEIVHHENQI